MSNPATHVATASAIASSSHPGLLHCPAMARYPPTGAMARLIPSQRWGHEVNRLAYEYASTQASAAGASSAQSGFSSPADTRNTSPATITDTHACLRVSVPVGSSRFAVRAFRASNSRSAIRLNPMAAHRAPLNATATSTTCRQVTGATRLAASTPRSANGSANSVCGSFTKLM